MEISLDSFSIIIAYVLPGVVAMLGLAQVSTTVRGWATGSNGESVSLGGAALFMLAALAAGLTASTIRSYTIDDIHFATGVEQADWDYGKMAGKLESFQAIVDNRYRYHQFYGNTFISTLFSYSTWRLNRQRRRSRMLLLDLGVVGFLVVMWLGSRNNLEACYDLIRDLMKS